MQRVARVLQWTLSQSGERPQTNSMWPQKNTAKLDRETEELKHDKIPLDLGRLIQQGRQAKGWSQKELATKVNEKPQVINDYEAGRGIPNQVVIGKIERAIGVKLRGKERGKPAPPPGIKK